MICPACGGQNPDDAIFCGNNLCGKALGGYRYVKEEILGERRWHEKIAEHCTNFVGAPHFLLVHLAWFSFWILVNTGMTVTFGHFDAYPFSLLSILLAIEAIFITGFILITQNRQSAYSNKRAELDYEVTVLTSRKIELLETKIDLILRHLNQTDSSAPRVS